jgi:predicted nuclease with TOPRIM domain
MEELSKEIERLKEELKRRKEEIQDLKKLIRKEIDREFSCPLEELSEKELETYIRESLSTLPLHIESKPDIKKITSHRKTLGRPIVFIKRAFLETTFNFINSFLDRQTDFNRRIAGLSRAVLLRLGYNLERIKRIEERVGRCEESLAILKNKLEDLRSSQEELQSKPAGHPPK